MSQPSRRSPWSSLVLAIGLVLCGLIANIAAQHSSDAFSGPFKAKNAIVFVVDDMSDFSCAEASLYLPRSSEWLLDRGTCYENATTATPVCCPARAQLQTGQLAHNNKVVNQISAHNLDTTHTVQHDLGAAGITSYGIGKNLNGIEASEYYGPAPRPTGFDDFDFWNSYKSPAGAFQLYDDHGVPYVPTTGLSNTETNGAFLDAFLDDKLATDEPFYVYDAFVAPHKQSIGARPSDFPGSSGRHTDVPVPPFRFEPEPFADDKLAIFHGPRQYDERYYRRLFTARVKALLDVDDEMADTFERLELTGALDETAVIFTSDNGYTDRGQDNWEGKSIPYPAATDVPMLAYYPGRATEVVDKPVALIDVPATLYDLLDVTPGHVLDGHSLVGDHERELVYGEFYNDRSAVAREESGRLTSNLRSWRVLKQGRVSYVEWYGPRGKVVFNEYYVDPGMTKNLLYHRKDDEAPSPARVRELHDLLDQVGTCAGTVEQGSPNPCP